MPSSWGVVGGGVTAVGAGGVSGVELAAGDTGNVKDVTLTGTPRLDGEVEEDSPAEVCPARATPQTVQVVAISGLPAKWHDEQV
jgi:hypothetical protein